MYDIITFGSATRDIFLTPGNFKRVIDKKKFITGKGICFNLGSKVDIKEILFSSGGGGTNTAATFAKQGLRTAYCGAVGTDLTGQEIINELGEKEISTQFVFKKRGRPTSHSIVITGVGNDRTILVYRGASELLLREDIPFDQLRTKWFYIAPLSGKLCDIFEPLVDFGRKKGIKIAANPGNSQISLPEKKLKKILEKIDVLILNQEEASLLTRVPFSREKEIFKKIDKICPGIAIMTKGEKGVLVSDGKNIFSAKPPKIKAADRTGAGDSFASGFVSGLFQTDGNITYAIQLGIANASACIKKLGSKNGLLSKDENFLRVKVKRENTLK